MKNPVSTSLMCLVLFGIVFEVASMSETHGLNSAVQTLASHGTIVAGWPSATYFECSFSYPGSSGYGINVPWPSTEPCGYPNERGTWHWVNCGTNEGTLKIVTDPADPSGTCLQMLLDTPGSRPLPDSQHVKLYECSARESALWGSPYPTLKEAYWHVSYWFPSNFQVAHNSWRLIWQYNGEEGVYGVLTYAPQFALIFGDTDLELQATGYYYNNGVNRVYHLINNADLPKDQWVTFTIYVKQGSAFKAEDGTVTIWINGNQVYSSNTFSTATVSGTPYVIWSIGNYGGPLEAQGQYINVKDVLVTSQY